MLESCNKALGLSMPAPLALASVTACERDEVGGANRIGSTVEEVIGGFPARRPPLRCGRRHRLSNRAARRSRRRRAGRGLPQPTVRGPESDRPRGRHPLGRWPTTSAACSGRDRFTSSPRTARCSAAAAVSTKPASSPVPACRSPRSAVRTTAAGTSRSTGGSATATSSARSTATAARTTSNPAPPSTKSLLVLA